MNSFHQSLERLFETGSERLAELARHWQEHANRRTILVLVFAGTTAAILYVSVIQPPEDFPLNALVTIPPGAPLSETAAAFEAAGVVRSGFALKALMTLMGEEGNVHAGDYLFKEPKDLFTVARAISAGAYGLEPARFRVPEGATTKDMAVIFGNLERFDAERFAETARPLEGFLFPDTYFFLPNATDEIVLDALRNAFEARMAELEQTYGTSTRSRKDIVTMASILEKEAKNTRDRKMIAGVLWNRLDRGMLLQVDAVFLYTIGRTTFDLTMKDLASDSPYNTYRYKGLPPTPIGSPSLDSLVAAMTPTKSDYLFYLADNDHVTHYSKTYREHLRKKRLYLGS